MQEIIHFALIAALTLATVLLAYGIIKITSKNE
jgi:hypothetical protein